MLFGTAASDPLSEDIHLEAVDLLYDDTYGRFLDKICILLFKFHLKLLRLHAGGLDVAIRGTEIIPSGLTGTSTVNSGFPQTETWSTSSSPRT